jgi:sulfoxide reductase catalytic subunit YedY
MRKLPNEPPSSEITPPELFARRREFIKKAGMFGVTSVAWGVGLSALSGRGRADKAAVPKSQAEATWRFEKNRAYTVEDAQTPLIDVTTYNNFYELGVDKSEPAENAGQLLTRPWTVQVKGHVEHEQVLDLDTLISWFGLEERVYRMRCVEAWSMVIPWLGFPLNALIRRLQPTSRAKYVQFKTLLDEKQLPNQASPVLPWPYVESLRMDEAMNELSFMAVGLYGSPLPGQNGAPLRLVVPWKYGFKGIKSIVEIAFLERQPVTTWAQVAPSEYGFYANVNPNVDHPRWSQATERRIGELSRRDTMMFNGYAEQVAGLYNGLDLVQNF